MKSAIYLFIAALFISLQTANAQTAKVGCMDKAIRLQAEQIKQGFITQGMEVYKDAMINMESNSPAPIIVQLEKGRLYQFVFVGSRSSQKMMFELFDGNDNKIEEKVLKTPSETNYLVYSFVPAKSDMYLMVLHQKRKKDSMCGSFTIMQQPAEESKATPAANTAK